MDNMVEGDTNKLVSAAEKSTWSGKSDLALGDLSSNAYPGDKGKTAYDHSQAAHAPSGATVGADWNTNISNKPTLLTLGETETTAHRGDEGHTAYDHSQSAHAPSGATVGADWNTNVSNKPTLGTAAAENVGAFEAAGNVSTHAGLTTGVHGVGAGTIAKTADITATKLDDFATPDANTDLNANTTNHGLLLQATAPAAGLYNYVGITNGETVYSNKALFDATNPSTQAFGDAAVVGSATVAARRDHKHAMMSETSHATLATLASPTFTGTITIPATVGTPSTCTAAHTGTAIPLTATVCEITTDGDSDLDNATLANGTAGQIIYAYVKAVGNAADSLKITPATSLCGTIQFGVNPVGKGVILVYTSAGWACAGSFGRKIPESTTVTTGTAARTLTGAQLVAGNIQELTGTTSRAFTFDTGTNISNAYIAAYGAVAVGNSFSFVCKSSGTSSGTITFAAAPAGVTITAQATIAIGTSRYITLVNTGSNTWTVY